MSNWTLGHKGGVYAIGDGTPDATKVGIFTFSKQGEPMYQRLRALQQGNPRELIVHYVHMMEVAEGEEVKYEAKLVEDTAHRILLDKGYSSLYLTTKATGHGEWFDCSSSEAIAAIKEAVEECTSPRLRGTFGDFSDAASHIAHMRMMRGARESKIEKSLWGFNFEEGLFGGLR